MQGFPGMQSVLPGRMPELELDQVVIEFHGSFTLVVFMWSIDSRCAAIQFNIETRLWDIDICEAHFRGISLYPDAKFHDTFYDSDPLRVFQKLLVEGNPKKARHIEALRFWRNLLQIRPVKVIPLKKTS